jgi:hypothetical protein
VFDEINKFFTSYLEKPIFGVQCKFEETETDISKVTISRKEDILEIIESETETPKNMRSMYSTTKENKIIGDDEIEFNEDLGLAC